MTVAARLHAQLDHLEQLLDALARERDLLVAGDVDGRALADVAAEKQGILDALSLAAGNDPDGRRHADQGERTAREQGCAELWHHLLDRARHASRVNRFNGKLIDARLVCNQRLINDLHALAHKDLYGPDGHARGSRQRVRSHA